MTIELQSKLHKYVGQDDGPITAVILHARENKVICVKRSGKVYLAMWTTTEDALDALATQADGQWTMVAYKTAEREILFNAIRSSAPGILVGYVLDPNTPGELKRRVAKTRLAA